MLLGRGGDGGIIERGGNGAKSHEKVTMNGFISLG